jgi:hypothetical protein
VPGRRTKKMRRTHNGWLYWRTHDGADQALLKPFGLMELMNPADEGDGGPHRSTRNIHSSLARPSSQEGPCCLQEALEGKRLDPRLKHDLTTPCHDRTVWCDGKRPGPREKSGGEASSPSRGTQACGARPSEEEKKGGRGAIFLLLGLAVTPRPLLPSTLTTPQGSGRRRATTEVSPISVVVAVVGEERNEEGGRKDTSTGRRRPFQVNSLSPLSFN